MKRTHLHFFSSFHTLLRMDARAEGVLLEQSAVLSGDDDFPRRPRRRLGLDLVALGLRHLVTLSGGGGGLAFFGSRRVEGAVRGLAVADEARPEVDVDHREVHCNEYSGDLKVAKPSLLRDPSEVKGIS